MEFSFDNFDGSAKYRQLLNTGKALFFRYGVQRVSVEEICNKAHVSKMTFYKYFENKEELFLFIVKAFYDWGGNVFLEIWSGPGTFVEKIRQAVHLKMQISNDFSKELIMDLMNSPYPKVREAMAEYQEYWVKKILGFYIDAQQKGEIRQDIKPEFILYVLNQVSMWAEDENLMAIYDDPRDLLREVLNFYINGLIAREPIVSK